MQCYARLVIQPRSHFLVNQRECPFVPVGYTREIMIAEKYTHSFKNTSGFFLCHLPYCFL